MSTHVVDAGSGPPVVLIHGYGDTADGWRHVVPPLLRRHRVIALDVPPFGRSEKVREASLLDFFDEFFPQLWIELGVGPATVVGHSLGGAIALRLAIARPELVERLGLVAPAGLGERPPWWRHALATWGAIPRAAISLPSPLTPTLIRQAMTRFLDMTLVHDARASRAEIQHLIDMHSSPKAFTALLNAGRCCIDTYSGSVLDDSRAIDCPIWLLWGRHDALVPWQDAFDFRDVAPHADVHILEDCGHYPQIELPAAFNRALTGWLASTRQVLPRAA